MEIITYSPDVDILLLKISDAPIEYAEESGGIIAHFSPDDKPVLLEIQDAKAFIAQAHGRVFGDG